ncbi:MAG: metallophosphoesterase family protein [Kiritimatiellia bacterium]|jgi:3',5'-cyclic AMP phosphodiesterase CpdA
MKYNWILFAACGAMMVIGCVGPRVDHGGAPVVFVQVSDSHYGNPLHAYRFRQAAEQINALPFDVAVVVHTGDFSSDNLHIEATGAGVSNLLSLIDKPLLCVPGNHDLLAKGANAEKRLAACADVYSRYIGPLGSVYETNGVVFIAVYTEPLRGQSPSVAIEGFDPLAWLEAEIKKAGDKPTFVFTHTPDGEDFYNNELHPGWPEENRRAWRRVLARGNVKAIIAGHYHRDELQQGEDGIPLHVGNAIANFWGRQASFRIYTYEAGRLSYRTVYIEDPPPRMNVNPDGTTGPPTVGAGDSD